MLKAILVAIIPLIISLAGIHLIKADHSPEVVKLPAAYGPGTGYALEQAEYTVTASPHFRWSHGTGKSILVIMGCLLFIGSGVYVYVFQKQVWQITWKGIAVFWILGFVCIFGLHSFRYYKPGVDYYKTVSEQVYEQNKANLDAIFEQ